MKALAYNIQKSRIYKEVRGRPRFIIRQRLEPGKTE